MVMSMMVMPLKTSREVRRSFINVFCLLIFLQDKESDLKIWLWISQQKATR
jgi:hypothetical protein